MNICSFSGFIPEQICDTVRFISHSGDYPISHYCGYASDFIARVRQDPDVDGAVFPRSCDSCRAMAGYLADCRKFIYQLHVPARRDDSAVQYLAADIRRYQRSVEEYYGVTITDIPERTAMINARNCAISKLYENLPDISYNAYLNTLHNLLQTPLYKQSVPDNLPGKNSGGKRVYLIGSLLCNTDIVSSVERAGLSVVGDRLTESKRWFSAPEVPAEGNLYENIAKSILYNCVSPTQDCFDAILEEDMREIRDKRVQGVIFVTQKFCEPYDFLFQPYKRMLDGQDISVLHITLSGSAERQNFDTRIESFADILKG